MKLYLNIKDKRLNVGSKQIAMLRVAEVKKIQRVFIRVRLYNPKGERHELFNQSIIAFPQAEKNIELIFDTLNQPPGFFRFETKIFNDGLLQLTETVENDCFYVDEIEINELIMQDNCVKIKLTNLSPEKTPLKILAGDSNVLDYELEALEEKALFLPKDITCMWYGNQVVNLSKLLTNGDVFFRLHRLFWREESQNEVFVYDPKAEGKKRLVLKGFAKYLWEIADGVRAQKLKPEEMAVMEKVMSYGIINKID